MSQFSIRFLKFNTIAYPDVGALALEFAMENVSKRIVSIHSYQAELWLVIDDRNGCQKLANLEPDIRGLGTDPNWQLLAQFKGVQSCRFRVLWHYAAEQLQRVEDVRKGNDAYFQVRLQLFTGTRDPGETEEIQQCEWPRGGDGWPIIRIAESDWAATLASIRFTHPVMDRLPWPAMPPEFGRLQEWLERAWQDHRAGNHDGAMVSCYKAFDCLGFNVYGLDVDKKKTIEKLMETAEEEKREIVSNLILSLQKFFHLARHESKAPVALTHFDSQLALLCATTLLSYLAPYRRGTLTKVK